MLGFLLIVILLNIQKVTARTLMVLGMSGGAHRIQLLLHQVLLVRGTLVSLVLLMGVGHLIPRVPLMPQDVLQCIQVKQVRFTQTQDTANF